MCLHTMEILIYTLWQHTMEIGDINMSIADTFLIELSDIPWRCYVPVIRPIHLETP